MPAGEPMAVEQAAMAAVNLTPEAFRQSGKLRVKGARRPLRVRPTDVELAGGGDEFGPHITVAFTLPAGAFATVLVRELMKTDADDASGEATVEDDAADPVAEEASTAE